MLVDVFSGLEFSRVLEQDSPYQVEQATDEVVYTGLVTVHGQLVMVRVVACSSLLACC